MLLHQCSDLQPASLTTILSSHGALTQGTVQSVSLVMESAHKGFVSNIATFVVSYSSDAQGSLPQQLFLKLTKPELHPEYRQVSQHEVIFYTELAPSAPLLPIPCCYYAEWDADTSQAAILLDDLSHSHVQRPLPIPPSPHQATQIISSLARLHAQWWNDPELGVSIGRLLQQAEADAIIERLQRSFPFFIDYLGDVLLPAQRLAYERILSSSFLQRRMQRLLDRHNLTLIHGDAHTNNVLLPIDGLKGKAMLIDWHRWNIEVGLHDLAFLIALHWSRERRATYEYPLVRQYYQHLVQYGVETYMWDECWNDYREAVTVMTLIPIGQHRRQMPAGVIWYEMEQSIAAFNDLGCAELL